MSTSTISVSAELKKRLNELKLHPKESYTDVISRLVAWAEDPDPLSDEEIGGIKEALDDMKAGHMRSSNDIRRDLGL